MGIILCLCESLSDRVGVGQANAVVYQKNVPSYIQRSVGQESSSHKVIVSRCVAAIMQALTLASTVQGSAKLFVG